MQQWTLERNSESPESTGRPSVLQRDVKQFRSENRYARFGSRVEMRTRLSSGGGGGRSSGGHSFPHDPIFNPGRRSDSFSHSTHLNEEGGSEEEEGRSSVPQRLSRHIPQRAGIDMAVSSFNLITSPVCLPQPAIASPRGFGNNGGGGGSSGVGVYGRGGGGSGGASAGPVGRSATPSSSTAATSAAAPAAPAAGIPPVPAAAGAGLGGSSVTAGSTVSPTPASSALTSFSESMVSDDSSYMTSLYNDVLASNLIGPSHRSSNVGDSHPMRNGSGGEGGSVDGHSGGNACLALGDVGSHRRGSGSGSEEGGNGRQRHVDGATTAAATAGRRGLGGEVLRFADMASASDGAFRGYATVTTGAGAASPVDTAAAVRVATYTTKGGRGGGSATAAPALPRVRSRTFYTAGGGGGSGGSGGGGGRSGGGPRVFNTTPERVLDAPQFPSDATQLLDWGANNAIAIGMGQSLYSWNGDSGQAAKMVDLDSAARIKCVQWLHKCSCVALSVQAGTTAIYDCRSSDFLRTVRLPAGLEVTGLSVKGPVMAVASDGPLGTTCAYDLRAKDALIATYEGHRGGVASLHYCAAEPFYLATGGNDGSVRVWDARRAATPRYAFDGVHQGRVNVVRWDPQKRSRLFTGGEDGVLCLMDTHAPKRTLEMDHGGDEEGLTTTLGNTQEHLAQYITRAVHTLFPISGLVCHGTSGEVVTAHKLKGQLQLRKTSTFHLMSTFTALHCDAALSCLTMAPDKESVCAAQGDDTLKFWRVFDNGATRTGERGGAGAHGNRADWGASHQDPTECFDEALR